MVVNSTHLSSLLLKRSSYLSGWKTEHAKFWQRSWITHRWLEGMKNGTATLESSLTVSYKTKHVITVQPSNCTLGHLLQRNENSCSHKNLCVNVLAPGWRQLRRSSVNEWISKLGHIHKVGVVVIQSYPTLCGPMDCSPPGSSVHGILQARILEWVAMPSSRGSSRPRAWTCIS